MTYGKYGKKDNCRKCPGNPNKECGNETENSVYSVKLLASGVEITDKTLWCFVEKDLIGVCDPLKK